jgi:hypothetical protein
MIARLVIGLISLGVGLGVGIHGGLTFAGRFSDPLSAPYESGQFSQHLQTGRYLVYAAPVSSHTTPADLTVSSPSGTPVPVSAFTGDESQTRGGTTYDAFAQFHAATAGVYHLALATSGPPRIIVAQTLLDAAKSLVRSAIETVVGAIVALIGATVLVRMFTRRWWRLQDARALWASGGGQQLVPGQAVDPSGGGRQTVAPYWTPPPPGSPPPVSPLDNPPPGSPHLGGTLQGSPPPPASPEGPGGLS